MKTLKELNPNYWDCECEVDYIHPKEKTTCTRCGAIADDQPDSREIEVKYYYPHQN